MGIESEGALGGVTAMNQEQVEGLRTSAATITRELQALTERVSDLVAAVESMGPIPAGRAAPRKEGQLSDVLPEADDSMVTTVTVAPLPELAMAAVAETTLRNLPSVRQVTGVKREGDWARFTLDISPDADLISEMKVAMPVAFKVTESNPGAITLTLQWAWGTS